MTILVQQLRAEIEQLTRERDQLKVNVDALLCDCPEYSDVERLCHVLGYLGYSTPSGGEASARWLSLVKELIGAVETSELLRRDKEAVAEYRQLKAENAELRRYAERYRWLRNKSEFGTRHDPAVYKDGPTDDLDFFHGDELDAAIDQAMTKEQP